MAKSKEQKQQEALERKRSLFEQKAREVKRYNPGGDFYEEGMRKGNPEYTRKLMDERNAAFGRYLKEAKLNSRGEPIHVDENGLRFDHVVMGKRWRVQDHQDVLDGKVRVSGRSLESSKDLTPFTDYTIHQHLNEL